MIISGRKGYKIHSVKDQEILCDNCNNLSMHEVFAFPKGVQLKFIWMPQRLGVGLRDYYLKCPICDHLTKQLTLTEVNNMKGV